MPPPYTKSRARGETRQQGSKFRVNAALLVSPTSLLLSDTTLAGALDFPSALTGRLFSSHSLSALTCQGIDLVQAAHISAQMISGNIRDCKAACRLITKKPGPGRDHIGIQDQVSEGHRGRYLFTDEEAKTQN